MILERWRETLCTFLPENDYSVGDFLSALLISSANDAADTGTVSQRNDGCIRCAR
jgi:hypothetical protein